MFLSFPVENHGGVLDHTLSHTASLHRRCSRREETCLRNHGVFLATFQVNHPETRDWVC